MRVPRTVALGCDLSREKGTVESVDQSVLNRRSGVEVMAGVVAGGRVIRRWMNHLYLCRKPNPFMVCNHPMSFSSQKSAEMGVPALGTPAEHLSKL